MFRLILTEDGQRTPRGGLETLCPGIWLTCTNREPDHIHHCGPVKGTKHYSLIAWEFGMDYCLCHCHLLSPEEEASTWFYVVGVDPISCLFSLHDNNL